MPIIRRVIVSGTNLLTLYQLSILWHTRKARHMVTPIIFPASVYLFLLNPLHLSAENNFGVLAQLV